MKNIVKLAMAVAMLFAVNMNANAQFGKLKGLANKAKETVSGSDNATTTTSESSSSSSAFGLSPKDQEKRDVEKAGGLQQYLGLTEGDGLILWEYASVKGKYTDYRHDTCGESAYKVVNLMRWTKNENYDDPGGAINYAKFPERVDAEIGHVDAQGKLVGQVAKKFLNATGKGSVKGINAKDAMPKAEYDALVRATIKAIKEFEAKYGPLPLN
ncbi:MAG: hypothetical protein IJG74_08670 [Prevotella sp.]|nr:hypothetical protein [Prevotella sp.]